MSIGFEPAATRRAPSLKMAWASTVAVVVPVAGHVRGLGRHFLDHLPAHVGHLVGKLDFLATVTPSLVTVGEPHDFSMMTFASAWTQRRLDGVGENVEPLGYGLTGGLGENMISLAAMMISFPAYSMTPRMSSSRRIMCSTPSILMSLPSTWRTGSCRPP